MSIFNFRSNTDSTDDEPTTATGESYATDLSEENIVERFHTSDGKELAVKTADGETYAGEHLRKQIESLVDAEETLIPIGYHDDDATGVSIGRLPLKRLFVHLAITGTTGAGKSTLVQNIQLALAWAGYGFAYIEGKGDGDAMDLLQRLPEHRMGDVIPVMPSSPEFGRTPTLNLLETPTAGTQEDVDAAVGRQIDAVKTLFDTSEYWGIVMEFIVDTVSRIMIESDEDYALIDMPFVLFNADWIAEFAGTVESPFSGMPAEKLATLEEDDVLPVWRRMAAHMASATKRPIISERETTLDFEELMDENKIVIIQPPDAGGDISEFLSLIYFERFWTTQRQRSRRADGEVSPYFCFIDESDKVLSPSIGIEDALARARSSRFGIGLLAQYGSQWEDVSKSVAKAIQANTKNKLALSSEERDSASFMTQSFQKIDADDVAGMDFHRVAAKLPRRSGGDSEHFLETFPPMPELRTAEEAREHLRENLKEVGKEPVTDEEILSNLKYGSSETYEKMMDAVADGEASEDTDDEAPLELTERREALLCQAVCDEALQDAPDDVDGTERTVHEDAAARRMKRYLAADGGRTITYDSQLWDLVDGVPDDLIETTVDDDGTSHLRCTARGQTTFTRQGSDASAAHKPHRETVKDTHEPFTRLGAFVRIVNQTSGDGADGARDTDDLPDVVISVSHLAGLAELPDADTLAAMSPRQRRRLEEDALATFREAHPELAWLSEGSTMTGEIECSTGESNPYQTLMNLAQALARGQRCLFFVRSDVASKVWNTVMDNGPYSTRGGEPGLKRCYNGGALRIDGQTMYRPAGPSETVWLHDDDAGTYSLADSDGERHATFETADAIFEDADAYPFAAGPGEDVPDEWAEVKRPFVPDYEFDLPVGELRDEFEVVVVPGGTSTIHELSIYRDGETASLEEVIQQDTSASDGGDPGTSDSSGESGDSEAPGSGTSAESGASRDSSDAMSELFDDI